MGHHGLRLWATPPPLPPPLSQRADDTDIKALRAHRSRQDRGKDMLFIVWVVLGKKLTEECGG